MNKYDLSLLVATAIMILLFAAVMLHQQDQEEILNRVRIYDVEHNQLP